MLVTAAWPSSAQSTASDNRDPVSASLIPMAETYPGTPRARTETVVATASQTGLLQPSRQATGTLVTPRPTRVRPRRPRIRRSANSNSTEATTSTIDRARADSGAPSTLMRCTMAVVNVW